MSVLILAGKIEVDGVVVMGEGVNENPQQGL